MQRQESRQTILAADQDPCTTPQTLKIPTNPQNPIANSTPNPRTSSPSKHQSPNAHETLWPCRSKRASQALGARSSDCEVEGSSPGREGEHEPQGKTRWFYGAGHVGEVRLCEGLVGARIFARSGGAQPQPRGRHRHKRPQKRSDVGDRGVEERSGQVP